MPVTGLSTSETALTLHVAKRSFLCQRIARFRQIDEYDIAKRALRKVAQPDAVRSAAKVEQPFVEEVYLRSLSRFIG